MAEEEQPIETPPAEPEKMSVETPELAPAGTADETPTAAPAEVQSGVAEESQEETPAEIASSGVPVKRVAEALVFASPKPITTPEIVAALKAAAEGSEILEVKALGKTKAAAVDAALTELAAELEAAGRAFQLVEKVSGWVLVSDPACAAWVRQLYPEAKPTRLTGPQLETLAIIAYRQPVTRADIEAVRGVAVDGVMQVLLDRSLVKIAGRADVPGRPLLYSTTEYFLEHFGLKNTDELPNASELKRVVLPTAPVEVAKPAEAAPADTMATETAPADAVPSGESSEVAAELAGTSNGEPVVEDSATASEAPVEATPLEEIAPGSGADAQPGN